MFVLKLTATSASVCPVQSQWSLRANSLCNSTQRYFCLFDENALEYSEFCGSTPDFERSGVYTFFCWFSPQNMSYLKQVR